MSKLSAFLFVALLSLPSVALAGGCPTCTTSADCMPPGGGEAFCVEWSRDFGCGGQRIACCPGQACNITAAGRPLCEGADSDGDGIDDCTVVGAAGVDGGGPMGIDAGVIGSDGGTTGTDGGATGVDAGGGGTSDAGTTPVTDGGCGCRVGASGTSPALALFVIGALGVALRRRR